MDLIIITGPQAVGKMTVGLEIEKKIGYKLFHNHMTIEPVVKLFDYGSKEAQHLIRLFREEIFNSMMTSGNQGYIFTYVWAFNEESDNNYIKNLIQKFEDKGNRVLIVELESDVDTRINRNDTELRLNEKPTKRNVEWSKNDIIESMKKYRLNSYAGEITHPNYLRINNENLEATVVADKIIKYFDL